MKQSPKLPKYLLLLWEKKYLYGLCRDIHVQLKTGVQSEGILLGKALLSWFLFLVGRVLFVLRLLQKRTTSQLQPRGKFPTDL